jgi:hypothetical protein
MKKARHPVGLFRISHFRYNSCPTSRPDAQTYHSCFMFWNVLFPDELILGDLDRYEYGSLTGIGVRKSVHG